jgi:hypothetical protein
MRVFSLGVGNAQSRSGGVCNLALMSSTRITSGCLMMPSPLRAAGLQRGRHSSRSLGLATGSEASRTSFVSVDHRGRNCDESVALMVLKADAALEGIAGDRMTIE